MGSTEVKNKFIDFNKSQIMLPKSCLFTLFPHFRDLRPWNWKLQIWHASRAPLLEHWRVRRARRHLWQEPRSIEWRWWCLAGCAAYTSGFDKTAQTGLTTENLLKKWQNDNYKLVTDWKLWQEDVLNWRWFARERVRHVLKKWEFYYLKNILGFLKQFRHSAWVVFHDSFINQIFVRSVILLFLSLWEKISRFEWLATFSIGTRLSVGARVRERKKTYPGEEHDWWIHDLVDLDNFPQNHGTWLSNLCIFVKPWYLHRHSGQLQMRVNSQRTTNIEQFTHERHSRRVHLPR